MPNGAAKVIATEKDLSSRVQAKRGVYIGAAAPLVRGPVGVPFLVTTPEEFLEKTTPDGRIKIGYDQSYLEVLTALEFTNKVWLIRAARNAKFGAAYLRSSTASGQNFPAEYGFSDVNSEYDLTSKDGRPQVAPAVVSVDADQEYLTVAQQVYDLLDTGDAVEVSSTGILPLPLVAATTYYVYKATENRKIGLAASLEAANTKVLVDLTSFGTGVHSLQAIAKVSSVVFNATVSGSKLAVNADFYAAADTGDAVQLTTTGSLPAGLLQATTYYVIKGATANEIKLAATAADAVAGITLGFTTTGSGTNTVAFNAKAVSGTFTVDMSDDTFTTAPDTFYTWLKTGDKLVFDTDSGTLPTGVVEGTEYFAIKLPQINKFKLATTLSNAVNGVSIAIDNPGSGVITVANHSIVDESVGEDKVLLIYGANPGKWNNDISFKLTNYSSNPQKVREPDAFLIEVYQGTSLVESFLASRDPEKKDGYGKTIYVEDVLLRSSFIRAIDNVAIDHTVRPKDQATLLILAGGTDGDSVTDSVMIDAIKKLEAVDEYPLAVIFDSGWTTPAYQTSIIDICERRGDCAFVFSVPFEVEASDDYMNAILNYKLETLNSVSSYGGIWTSHLRISDTDNNREVLVAPSAHVAGKIAYVWDTFEPWIPAAGNKRGGLNVLGVHRTFTPGQMDVLYDANINPIRWKRGKGTTIWGQKTLQTRPSDLDRMNARLLLCVIKPAIKELLEDYLFDLATVENDLGTRAAIRAVIINYMNSVAARNGVYDFQVICDDRNNKPSDVANNILRVWLLIKITKSVEYIPFDLGITPYDLDFKIAETLL